ncbi:hypothetical protein Glove_271g5 [Diversispora epigaea]|uniref:TLDc domain-containing protein n=1 Tax=Diversispora epigaea TaxID=1348612 RepID=A0A397I697_9GLOM|nr:hypothetical protein Glove_271g5 [Diversispora epigaea]
MKVKGTEEILGGYNPLIWNANAAGNSFSGSGNWERTNDSFIFSLKNGNIQNSILSRVKLIDSAIWNAHKNFQQIYGPWFGDELGMFKPMFGKEIVEIVYKNNGYYENPIRTRTMTNKLLISDYEVFKVNKKT